MNIFETERLALRELNLDDAAFISQLVNEPAWLRFIGDRGVDTLEAAQGYIQRSFVDMYAQCGFGFWLVARKADAVPIGICGLIKRASLADVDLGFAFLSRYRRNGYAFEAASATAAHARNVLRLARIVAVVTPDNEDSRRLLEKLGFRFKRMTTLTPGASEVMLYALTR